MDVTEIKRRLIFLAIQSLRKAELMEGDLAEGHRRNAEAARIAAGLIGKE